MVDHRPDDPLALLRDATLQTRRGELDAGLRLATGALGLFRQRGDRDGRMRTINLLGAIAWERGELEVAERSFDDALALAHDLGDSILGARASNNLASVANLRGDPGRALSLYRAALLDYQRTGDRRGMAETWHNLSLTWRELDQLEESARAALEAVHHAARAGDASLLALAMTGRAETAHRQGQTDLARKTLARARQLAHDAEDTLGVAEADRVDAMLLLDQGEPARALAVAVGARKVALELGSALLAAECAAVAALAARRSGSPREADTLAAQARDGFTALGARQLLARFDADWMPPS